MTIRVQTIDEKFAAAIQNSGEGVEATPVTADIIPFIEAAIEPQREDLFRADKGLGRSEFGIVRGGNQSGQWNLTGHLLLAPAATPVTASPWDQLLQAALGAAPVSISTTVDDPLGNASSSVFNVASASGIQVGDPLAVLIGSAYEMRPVSAIAGSQLTFSPAFSGVPAHGAVVKARIIRLATAPVFLTLVNWLPGTDGNDTDYSRKALDALVGELVMDFNSSIIGLAFSGPAPKVFEGAPHIPAIPSLPSFSDLAQSRNFGKFFWGGTKHCALELQLTLNNGSALLPVCFGSLNPDGAVHGKRSVRFNIALDANSDNDALRADAEAKTERQLFFHSGDSAGTLFGVNCRKAVLSTLQQEKGAETLRARFGNSGGFASAANNEMVIAYS
jgi:hypothetical protein